MFKNITKTDAFSIFTAFFCSCLIISNVLAFKTFEISFITLPCAVIIFPVLYIVNDVLTEIYGFEKVKNIIFLGFFLNLIAVIAYEIAIYLPAPSYFVGADAFALVLGNSLRILIASFISYIIGSLVNSYIMDRLKEKFEKYLFGRCILSTICGEGLDALIFISIAFIGTMPFEALLIMIVAQALFKTAYEIVIYPLTRFIINKVKGLPQ